MESIRRIHNDVRHALKGSRLALMGCASIATMTADRNIVVFLRTDEELGQKMLELAHGQYPLELLMNHYTVYGALVERFMRGELTARSEPFTASFADIPGSIHTPERGLWGTSVDTENGIWQVPRVDFTVSRKQGHWQEAMLVNTWSPHPIVPRDCPSLALIHVPAKGQLTDRHWRRVLELTWGYNTVVALSQLTPEKVRQALTAYKADVLTAQAV